MDTEPAKNHRTSRRVEHRASAAIRFPVEVVGVSAQGAAQQIPRRDQDQTGGPMFSASRRR